MHILLVLALYTQSLPCGFSQNAPDRTPVRIKVVAVHGEGVINNVGQKSSQDPVVRVEDENDRPVAGATVVFTLPTEGASGVFGNGEKTLISVTGPQGEAEAKGLRVNATPGKLQVHVNASYRGQTARLNMTQFNMAVPGKRAGGGSAKTVIILLAIAGAAGGGAAAALSRGNGRGTTGPSGVAPTPIGINAGSGTVGPPR